MKPLIGITSNYRESQLIRFVPESTMIVRDWQLLPGNYVRAIENAGGVPVILPVLHDPEIVAGLSEHLSGVLFTGGADVAAWRYGEHVRNGHGGIVEARDRHEMNLAKWALESTKLPILGICRGLQLLNIVTGGTLYQDIQTDDDRAFVAHDLPGAISDKTLIHEVEITPGSRIHAMLGVPKVMVNSFHHQSVRKVGEGFNVTGTAPDGCVEAAEFAGDRFVVGVQWHPEALESHYAEHTGIFSAFVNACRG